MWQQESILQGRTKARRKESFKIKERRKEGEVCITMVSSSLSNLMQIWHQNHCPHKPQLYECCYIPHPERQSHHNTG